MARFLTVAVLLLTCRSSLMAQQPQVVAKIPAQASKPELLLSPTTQFYLRWDGITAHNAAYKDSIWGGVMAGPTGDTIRTMIAKAPRQLGGNLLSAPLLEGKDPRELKLTLDDLKSASRIIEVAAGRGIVLAAEVREPRPSLKGITGVLGGLVNGKLPGAEALIPDVHLLAIVPDAAASAEGFHAAIRLLLKSSQIPIADFTALGRHGFQMQMPEGSPLVSAWWVEDQHFVFYVGTMKVEAILAEMTANTARGGITTHPLYQRCLHDPGYESVARGFVDTDHVVTIAKGMIGPFVPGLPQRLDDLGFGNLKAIVFNSGFRGKESRASYEFDLPGERKGLARALKPQPLTLTELPPLPPDVSRFSALRVDARASYDAAVMALETLRLGESFEGEDKVSGMAAKLKYRREAVSREIDTLLGIAVQEELVPYLGDKVLLYQSPTEGLSLFGSVLCVSLKDPAKVRALGEQVQRSLETIVGATIKVRKKRVRDIEVRELYSKEFGFLTPSFAIVGEWLVVAFHPQCIQGLILRTTGELPAWKPDATVVDRLSKMPAGASGIQYCDPRSTTQNLCCIAPLALGTFTRRNPFNESEKDYNPIDIGLIPNAHELSRHLFPNLTLTRDDGKTVHVEVNESFSLPFEAVGFELFAVIGLFSAFNN